MRNKKIIIVSVILTILLIVGVFSGIYVLYRNYQLKDYNSYINEIKTNVTDNSKKKDKSNTYNFKSLKKMNSDVIGWLTIPNTKIDTPVTHTSDNDFYLRHDFYKNYNYYGNAFMDCNCDNNSQLKIIYAHNMGDDAQFGTLPKLYKNISSVQKNKMITYETKNGKSEWLVIGAYYTNGDDFYKNSDNLRNAFETGKDKAKYLETLKNKFIYSADVVSDEFDNYLELYTCSYSPKGKRFVVVAREKRQNELIETVNYK